MRIICKYPNKEDRRVDFAEHRIFLGTAPSNGIVMDAVGVSEVHAVLLDKDDGLYIQDLDSLNGTYLNRSRIWNEQKLSSGDTLQMGTQQIRVELGGDGASATLCFVADILDVDDSVDVTAMTVMLDNEVREQWNAEHSAVKSQGTTTSSERYFQKGNGDGEAETDAYGDSESGSPSQWPAVELPCGSFSRGSEVGGKYIIEDTLGKGGMGKVYLAKHVELGTARALKVLSKEMTEENRSFFDRFEREAKLAAKISHPNVVGVMDYGIDMNLRVAYIVMEYVDGGSLRQVLQSLKSVPYLSEEQAVIIVESIAQALHAAEVHKIVHRDVKPDNIMFTKQGTVKLADLGIAKNDDEDGSLTKTNAMIGTPAYLPPEQISNAHDVDIRADIYSLGATFYEMLTGQHPYPGKTALEVLRKLLSDPVPDPRKINPGVSRISAGIVMKMLAKDADGRYGSALELIKTLENAYPYHTDIEAAELIKKAIAGEYAESEIFHDALTPSSGLGKLAGKNTVVLACVLLSILVLLLIVMLYRQGTFRPLDAGELCELHIATTPNATVRLTSDIGSVEYSADDTGNVTICNLRQGDYEIWVTCGGYSAEKISHRLVKNAEVSVKLTSLAEIKARQKRKETLEALSGSLKPLQSHVDNYKSVSQNEMDEAVEAVRHRIKVASEQSFMAGHEGELAELSKEVDRLVAVFNERAKTERNGLLESLDVRLAGLKAQAEKYLALSKADMKDAADAVYTEIENARTAICMTGHEVELDKRKADVATVVEQFAKSKEEQAKQQTAKVAELSHGVALLRKKVEQVTTTSQEDMDEAVADVRRKIKDAGALPFMQGEGNTLRGLDTAACSCANDFKERKASQVRRQTALLHDLNKAVVDLQTRMLPEAGSQAERETAAQVVKGKIGEARKRADMADQKETLDKLLGRIDEICIEYEAKLQAGQRDRVLGSLNDGLKRLQNMVETYETVSFSAMDDGVKHILADLETAQKDACFKGHEARLETIRGKVKELAETFKRNKNALADRERPAVLAALARCQTQLEKHLAAYKNVTQATMDKAVKDALDEVAKTRNAECMKGHEDELDDIKKKIDALAEKFRKSKIAQAEQEAKLEQERAERLASLEKRRTELEALVAAYEKMAQSTMDKAVQAALDEVAVARKKECMKGHEDQMDAFRTRFENLAESFKQSKLAQAERERAERLASLGETLKGLKDHVAAYQNTAQVTMDKAVQAAHDEVAKARKEDCMKGHGTELDEIKDEINGLAETFKKSKIAQAEREAELARQRQLAQERTAWLALLEKRQKELKALMAAYQDTVQTVMDKAVQAALEEVAKARKEDCMKGHEAELDGIRKKIDGLAETFRTNKLAQERTARLASLEKRHKELEGLVAKYEKVAQTAMDEAVQAVLDEVAKARNTECMKGHEDQLDELRTRCENLADSFKKSKQAQAERERQRREKWAVLDEDLNILDRYNERFMTVDAAVRDKAVQDALDALVAARKEECMKGYEGELDRREADVQNIKADFERKTAEQVKRQTEQLAALAKGMDALQNMAGNSDAVTRTAFGTAAQDLRTKIDSAAAKDFMKGTEAKIGALKKDVEACEADFVRKNDQDARTMLNGLRQKLDAFEKLTADVSNMTDDKVNEAAAILTATIGDAGKKDYMAVHQVKLDELKKSVEKRADGFKAAKKRKAWEEEVFAQINGQLDGLKNQVENAVTVAPEKMKQNVEECHKLIEEVRKHKYADKVAGKLKDMEVEAKSLYEDFLRRKDGIAADEILNGLEEKLKKIQGKYEEPGLRMTMTEYDKEMANFTSLASGLDKSRGMDDPARQKRLASMKKELEKIKMAISSQEDRIVGANVKEVFLAKVTKVPRGTDKKNSKAYSVWKAEMREAMKTFLERPMADGDEEAYLLTQDCKILEPGLFGIQEKGPGESQEKGLFELMEYVSFFDALGYNDWARVDTLIKTLGSCQDALTGIQTEKVRNSLAVFYGEQLRRQSDVIQRKKKIVYTENTMKVRNRASEAIKDAQRKLEKLVMADK